MRLIRLLPRLVLQSLGVLVAGIVLAVAVLVLWMSVGPLPLDALTPLIESAVTKDGSLILRIGRTDLQLTHHATSLRILARDVRIDNHDGSVLATVPELNIGLAVKPLLRGHIVPTEIVFLRPQLHLVRDTEGKLQVDVGGSGGEQDTAGGSANAILRALGEDLSQSPGDGIGRWTSLRHLLLQDATLVFEDRSRHTVWRAQRVVARVDKTGEGVAGEVTLAFDTGGATSELRGGFNYSPKSQIANVRFDLANWQVAKLAEIAPSLEVLTPLRAALGGRLQFSIEVPARRLLQVQADLAAGSGSIVRPELPGGAVSISGAQLVARYDASRSRLDLDKLALDFGGPAAEVHGGIDGLDAAILSGSASAGGPLSVALEAEIVKMPADALGQYWPPAIATNAHDWVTANIRDGVVDEALLTTGFQLVNAGGDFAGLAIDHLDSLGGTLRMRALTVDYKHPLPPVRSVDATASFDRSHMVLLPTSGVLKGLRIKGGTINITGLDNKDQDIDIGLDIDGPLRDALEVLDSKPLRYAQRIGLDPAQVEGSAEAHLGFKFPLENSLTFDRVQTTASAALSGVTLRGIVAGRDLTEGELQLRLDSRQVALDGTANLAGVPAKLSWAEPFSTKDNLRSRYHIEGVVDDAARDRLGLSLPPSVSLVGPVGVNASVENRADGRGAASLQLDLGKAALGLPDLGWTKNADQPATAQIDLDLAGDRIAGLRAAKLSGSDADLDLTASLTPTQELERVDLRRARLGETNVTGSVARRPEGGWRAELAGSSFDASALMAQMSKPGSNSDQPPLVIDGKFDRVLLGPKREARQVVVQLFSDGTHWQSINLDLAPFGHGSFHLRFGEIGGERPFTFATNDLGASLRLFDISEHVSGGRLSAHGEATDQGRSRIFIGKIDGGNYRVLGAPILAKLLSLASFGGIAGLLTGDGIPFTRISAEFSLQDGIVTVTQGRTYGGAIGVNANGVVDLDKNQIDLSGTLVPAYTLNSILGNIPLIGDLLQGGKGQGLFAASFQVVGPLDDPKVSVNPLTALAPGFLRNLFLFEPAPPQTAQ